MELISHGKNVNLSRDSVTVSLNFSFDRAPDWSDKIATLEHEIGTVMLKYVQAQQPEEGEKAKRTRAPAKPKAVETAPKVEEPITIEKVREIAAGHAAAHGKDATKKVVNKYAASLAEVPASEYAKLCEDLSKAPQQTEEDDPLGGL